VNDDEERLQDRNLEMREYEFLEFPLLILGGDGSLYWATQVNKKGWLPQWIAILL